LRQVLQGKYKAIICDKDRYLLVLLRYIHLNPVQAGLAKHPEGYVQNGHRSYLIDGTAKIIDCGSILALLGGKKGYERFVLDGMNEDHNEEYYAVEDQRFLEEEGFVEAISRAAGGKEQRNRKKSIETAFKEIARRLDTTVELLRSSDRHGQISAERSNAIISVVPRTRSHRK
jgi:putative transposase